MTQKSWTPSPPQNYCALMRATANCVVVVGGSRVVKSRDKITDRKCIRECVYCVLGTAEELARKNRPSMGLALVTNTNKVHETGALYYLSFRNQLLSIQLVPLNKL